MYGIISPRDWGLAPATEARIPGWIERGVALDEWEERARKATYHWLMRNWREQPGAFAGHCKVEDGCYEEPQLTNLIAPWQCIAAYDRYGDEEMLQRAVRVSNWVHRSLVESHPMSMVLGGVRDAWCPDEVWVKFTAEFVLMNAGLYVRTQERQHLRRAIEGARFLVQAELHDHATKYDKKQQRWIAEGWQSFGRVIEAHLYLYEVTQDSQWLERALAWGEYALTLQAPDGGFYLINNEYYNTDLAADELRALTFLYEQTHLPQYLRAARRFADWHIAHQRPDGAWILTIDRFANPVSEYVGPGDMPNIAIALFRLHRATHEPRYLESALQAMGYALTQQVIPGSAHPYSDREDALWGYWSWDPYYDYSMSGDQITHFARGLWFAVDYLSTLDPAQVAPLAARQERKAA